MDENPQDVKPVSEENTPDESSTPEQTPEDVTQPEPAGEEQVAETEGEEPKKGYSQRVRELNERAKSAEQRAESLQEKLAQLTGPVDTQRYMPQANPAFNPQEPVVQDGEEISVAELNRRIANRDARLLQQADSQSELRMRQSEAITRINSEAGAVLKDYPELDPDDAENFNKDLSDSITEATEAYVKAQPYTASVKKFVARLMKPYKGAVETEVGKASEQIAKQVSQAALRPTSVSKQGKTTKEKSIAELEQELGIVQS